MNIIKILKSEDGSQFIESALWIVLFVLGVAVMINGLANATGLKFQELTQRVNEVGTP